MSKYTNQAKIEAYLQRSLTVQEVTMLPLYLAAVSNAIKTYTGRDWLDLPDSGDPVMPTSSTKLYDGVGQREVNIDDASSITQIELLDHDGIEISSNLDDYILYPLNKTYKESIAMQCGRFPRTLASVRVHAVFTSGPVPDEVVAVATLLASNAVSGSASASTPFQSESIEGYSYTKKTASNIISENQSTMALLDSFKKFSL